MRDFQGEYTNGRGGEHVPVLVRVGRSGLRVLDAGETELAFWRLRDIRLVDSLVTGWPARLMLVGGGARLVVDAAVLAQLDSSGLGRRPGRPSARVILLGLGGALLVLAVIALAVQLALRLPDAMTHLVPDRLQAALGDRLATRLIAVRARETGGAGACAEAAGAAALERLVARLAASTGQRFTAQVLDALDAGVLALPGGRILLSRGLLEQSASPEEAAGALAQAIALTTTGRIAERLVSLDGISLLVTTTLGRKDPNPTAAEVARELAAATPVATDARALDLAATALLTAAGIRADAFAGLLERGALAGAADRAAFFRRQASGGPAMAEDDWRALRAICKA